MVDNPNKFKLKDKKALITGATGKIGQEIGKALADQGIHLALHYCSNSLLAKELENYAKNKNVRAITIPTDLREHNSSSELTKKASKELGGLDFLINCVGDFSYKPLNQLDSGEFREVIDSNLIHVYELCKEGLPYLRKSSQARIVNIGYANATDLTAKPNILPYHIAKLGLVLLTKSLAQSEKQNGILVNCISPGICENSEFWPAGNFSRNSLVKMTDLKELILFLLSSESITGTNIEIGADWK